MANKSSCAEENAASPSENLMSNNTDSSDAGHGRMFTSSSTTAAVGRRLMSATLN
jgi:hypothetical protein